MKTTLSVLAGILLVVLLPRSLAEAFEFYHMDSEMHESITHNVAKASLVIVAKVESVGTPPKIWSGTLAVYQEVKYQPISYLKRPPQQKEVASIVVYHPVVAHSLTVDPQVPKLQDSLFKPGTKVILFLQERDSKLETFDENYGVVRYSDETLQLIRGALRQ